MSAQLKRAEFENAAPTTTRRAAPVIAPPVKKRLFTAVRVFTLVTIALLAFGYWFPTGRYISPERGIGYTLGIVGGNGMLILLLYPLRKRMRWMSFMGTTKHWFQTHMVLGIVGPVLILYHSNFSLGATNSNVALVCMLVVSGSGLFGRYFYSRIHHGLYGTKATLTELQANAQRMRSVTTNVAFLPDLIQRVEAEEATLIKRCENTFTLLRPMVAGWWTIQARIRLYMYVRRSLRNASKGGEMPADRQERIYRTASTYIDTRLMTTRRVLEFDAYERLFSLWHVLHLPLFFMLVIAGIVHVIAVHVY
jgi:hypothetical protein